MLPYTIVSEKSKAPLTNYVINNFDPILNPTVVSKSDYLGLYRTKKIIEQLFFYIDPKIFEESSWIIGSLLFKDNGFDRPLK